MNMKWKISAIALCTAMSFAAFNAAAATSVVMGVKGTITPGSCTPTLSATDVDFGTINASSLTAVAPALNQLGSKNITLSIACTGATAVGIAANDNRISSVLPLDATSYIAGASANQSSYNVSNNAQAYGLGLAGDKKIGAYSISMKLSDITATDGADANVAVDMLSVRQSSTDWAKSVTGMMNPLNGTTANIITFARTGTLAPVAIKTATVPLSITAAVQALTNLPSSSEGITLDGNATIGILYL
jgi:type 1 fimbria pilin